MRLFVENALVAVARRRASSTRSSRTARRNPPDGAGWYAQAGAGAAHDAMARLGEIRVPTLVVHGTADNVVDARQRAAHRRRRSPARGSSCSTASAICCRGSGRDEFVALVEEFLA